MLRLPTEVLVEILVYAAASPDIDNRQRLELCCSCRAAHLAIHQRILLTAIDLHSPAQVHAFARSLQHSPALRAIAHRVTRSLTIHVLATDSKNGSSSSSSTNLYDSVQHLAAIEQNLTTPIRSILFTCTALEHLALDITPAPLDYRLRPSSSLSAQQHCRVGPSTARPPTKKNGTVWGKAPISHHAHYQRGTFDSLALFRSNLRELVCSQNVLGAGDFVDQLALLCDDDDDDDDGDEDGDTLPPTLPALGRWDRLESLQLLGPRFRLTCFSAKLLGLGLPALKRLALVMPNIMPPSRASNGAVADGGENAAESDEDDDNFADDPEELGRDLFLRMSPLQLLIDYLCPSDSILSDAPDKQPPPLRFEHLLLVGHEMPSYVGSAAKLQRWVEGLQYRVRRRRRPSGLASHDDETTTQQHQQQRYYVNPDERLNEDEDEYEEMGVQQPRVQLITPRIRPSAAEEGSSSPSGPSSNSSPHQHPTTIARWMLRRARARTNWTFGPDHPSRSSLLCLRNAPIELNGLAAQRQWEADLVGEERAPGISLRRARIEAELEGADEAGYLDGAEEECDYTLENFELPVTFLGAVPPRGRSSSGGGGGATRVILEPARTSGLDQAEGMSVTAPVGNSASTPLLGIPFATGPTHSAPPQQSNMTAAANPDLAYVDAALLRQQQQQQRQQYEGGAAGYTSTGTPTSSSQARTQTQTTIETIHPGRLQGSTHPGRGGQGGPPPRSLAAHFASFFGSSGWSGS
ncbi:hypothetical protein V8E36_000694 [Tilletia maclaganii]